MKQIVGEMLARFKKNSFVVSGILAFIPASDKFLNWEYIQPFAKHYRSQIHLLKIEMTLVRTILAKANRAIKTTLDLCIWYLFTFRPKIVWENSTLFMICKNDYLAYDFIIKLYWDISKEHLSIILTILFSLLSLEYSTNCSFSFPPKIYPSFKISINLK